MEHVLITGGDGKIGRLIRTGLDTTFAFDVYDIARGDDIFDESALKRRLDGVDAVIHLAAIPHPFHRGLSDTDYWRLNYEGTQVVLRAAASVGVRRFVFPSSGCVYGFWGGKCQPTEFPITEAQTVPDLSSGQTVYGATKLGCERFLEDAAGTPEVVVLRLESPGKHHVVTADSLVTDRLLTAGDIQTEGTLHRWHFWACISPRNFHHLITRALNAPLPTPFVLVNSGNADIESHVDHLRWLEVTYPGVPYSMSRGDALISIDRARSQLGYNPEPTVAPADRS